MKPSISTVAGVVAGGAGARVGVMVAGVPAEGVGVAGVPAAGVGIAVVAGVPTAGVGVAVVAGVTTNGAGVGARTIACSWITTT